MLVLTRRTQQSIVIGDGIVITVLDIRGDQIRLGIRAPRDVPVYREELLSAVGESNLAAVLGTAADSAAVPPAPAAPAEARREGGRARRARNRAA
ncbi:MAG TPA: carbon storage regulator CsrA [Mycobacteriales bacterium]|nr:carbon storage regulator CsrA [Mycobacteriales bacterium]